MMELFTRKPIFQSDNEIGQLFLIYEKMGTPTLESWPNVSELPWYELIRPREKKECVFRQTYEK